VEPETNCRAVVELRRASKTYDAGGNLVYALRETDLVLTPGSFTAIVGRSGCGKSTLLNLAGAVDLPTSGEVRIDGRSTKELNDDDLSLLRRRRIGFVFQFFNLLPTLTAAENVQLPLLLDWKRPSRAQRASVQQRVDHLLEMVGLAEKFSRLPHQLSGGEMQRVAIARALAHDPPVLVADEPTGNLDSSSAEMVLSLLRSITTEFGTTAVLMATHSKEAAAVAGRILTMRDGTLSGQHEIGQ
jgi:putative ABC transport system ATP-binding protein